MRDLKKISSPGKAATSRIITHHSKSKSHKYTNSQMNSGRSSLVEKIEMPSNLITYREEDASDVATAS